MKPFSRKIEKILAWIANTIMILMTGLVSLGAFSGQLETVLKQPQIEPMLNALMMDQGVSTFLASSGMSITTLFVTAVKIYAVMGIITLIIALIASFTMRSRIVSGILFLISAALVGLMTAGVMIPVYLLYFIVAVMLFVRKAPKNNDTTDFTQTSEKPEIDRLEYM
ncbi:DUF4064 domain-containing protein [uncultured Gemella sp.]|uniref:DUF4064 domain-containing protein n=1 Tax=uncultured Gemella sp. TaxID=254352 RepID=UPI0028D7F8EA|nr:hypothetical protein [uncultured Gemella sp.]